VTTKMPSEHAEQVRVFAHVSRLKAEGLRVGVPDLILPVARGEYHAMAIEKITAYMGAE